MAKLQNTQLTITINQSTQTADVLVKGQLSFNPNDVGNHLVGCSIFGDDTITDDFLFRFQGKVFGAGGFATVAPFEFLARVQLNILDEDFIGRDEIYAELTLQRDNQVGQVISRVKTDVVQISA